MKAVLLVSHGTVDALDDLGAFVTNVRRGRPPSPDVVAELRRRYEAIGGASPLNAITAEVTEKVGARLGVRTAWANRLWKPYVKDVLAALGKEGMKQVALVPLAPYSGNVYAEDAKQASEGMSIEFACAGNWGGNRALVTAWSARVVDALRGNDLKRTTLVFSAHSLPLSVIDAGDPYEDEVRAAAAAVAKDVQERLGESVHWGVAFQSQGMSRGPEGRPIAWLGPDLATTLDDARARGHLAVVIAPIGFLADHVEILYDLDIEAVAMAAERGLSLSRARSLNADDDFVDLVCDLARPLLHG